MHPFSDTYTQLRSAIVSSREKGFRKGQERVNEIFIPPTPRRDQLSSALSRLSTSTAFTHPHLTSTTKSPTYTSTYILTHTFIYPPNPHSPPLPAPLLNLIPTYRTNPPGIHPSVSFIICYNNKQGVAQCTGAGGRI